MIIKQLIDEDFTNYKKPSMFIGFPNCSFKCEKECGEQVCQNGVLAQAQNIDIQISDICKRYTSNIISKSLVCGGLEPFDSWEDLYKLVEVFRLYTLDDIIIYSGYNKNEIIDKVNILSEFSNITIKFGRFKPNQEKHYDKTLGIYLVSDNQYAERIS